jgi:hypothetical protein
MEVVDTWKPERRCEINTRFHGHEILDTNIGFRVNEHPTNVSMYTNSDRHFQCIPLEYISGWPEQNAFARKSFVNQKRSEVSDS